MRTLMLSTVVLLGGACSDTCGLGNQLNGRVYDAFAHPVEIDPAGTNLEGMPLYASPGNGAVQIGFEWGTANAGPITVYLDGQAFEGEGIFYDQDCGNFSASWQGIYLGEEVNGVASEHAIGVVGIFQFYQAQDGTQVLAGDLDWAETWRWGTATGNYSAPITELRGSIGGAAVTATQ